MAQCTQTSTAQSLNPGPTPPSPTPVIWAPLVQAPLQAAAATTPLALALAHHTQLPPILFHHPLAPGSGSLKDPTSHPKRVLIGANTSSTCGSGPGSPASSTQFRSGPVSPTVTSQPIFTSSLQPLTPLSTHQPPPHPPHSGIASVFPISQATVSYTCSAQLHSQPFHGAMTTQSHPVGLFQQGVPGRPAGRFQASSSSTISPLISSSISPLLSQLQQTPYATPRDRAGRTSRGLNLPHFPFITSTQSSTGFIQPVTPVPAGVTASLAQHSLVGLQSVFLPQVLPEHSALASLAQYGSVEGSPCCTPPIHSPSMQSPVRGRTVYHSELPSNSDSHSPLTPQTSCPARVACTLKERAESSVDLFTQEIKTISGSHSSIHQERPLAASSSSERVMWASSPFSSPMAVSKPYSPIPGQATPVSRTHSGPESQNQSTGLIHSLHARSPAKMLETEHKQSKLPSNLWGSYTPSFNAWTEYLLHGIVFTTVLSHLKEGGCVIIVKLEISGFILNQSEWICMEMDNIGQYLFLQDIAYLNIAIKSKLMGIYSTSWKYEMFCVLYYNHILSFVMCTSLKPHWRGTFV